MPIVTFVRAMILFAFVILALPATLANAAMITGISLGAGTDPSGTYSGTGWDTSPGGTFDIFVANGAPSQNSTILNNPALTSRQPSITLAPGTDTFSIYAQGSPAGAYADFSLFFNGNNTAPGISLVSPFATTRNFTPFSPFSGVMLDSLGGTTNGSGSLSFQDGSEMVTITQFLYAFPNVFGIDNVNEFGVGPSGSLNYVGEFTLSVTGSTPSVPEPGTAALLLTGLLIVAVGRSRKVRKGGLRLSTP